MSALGLVLAAGLLASACDATTLSARKGPTVAAEPLIAAETPTTMAVTMAWTPVQAAQNQAAQLEAAEEHYAMCYAYAGLDQSLVADTLPVNAPVVQSCSTTGLTPDEVQQIQGLIVES